MKLGVGEWGFRNLPMEEHCKITSRLGFRYMELGIGGDFAGRMSADMSDRELRMIKSCLKDYGLKTPFMCLENDFTRGSTEELEQMIVQVKKEALFAKQFDVTHLRLFAGFTPIAEFTEDTWSGLLRALREVNGFCETLGMKISIETHGALKPLGEGVAHLQTASTDRAALGRLLAELPRNVGINFDPGNLVPLRAGDPAEYLPILGDRINYCHLKDWVQNSDDSWTAVGVGEGAINWKKLLEQVNFDGIYLIEYEPTEDVEDGIRRSLTHLRGIFPDLEQ